MEATERQARAASSNGDTWERRRVEVSLRIERAGLTVLLEHGLERATVDQIAREAGISPRTFFRYFRNPRDVLSAVPLRESRRMCRALLARPVDEPLLDGFHAWFGGLPALRDGPAPVRALEVETLELWSGLVATAPDAVLVESRATRSFAAELEPVLRARSEWADPDDVGVLSVAFAAVISHVFVRSLGCGTSELSARLDRAFDLLAQLHPATELAARV